MTMGCAGGELGDEPVARCVPEGQCGEAMFQGGLSAALGDASRGAPIWARECARCHGPDGVGIAEARHIDMTSPAWQLSMRDGTIVSTLRQGRAPIMPAYTFNDDELRDLLAHIRSLKRDLPTRAQPAPSPTRSPGGY
ncbi:MAG TPA: c-type cytochrome [Myxococcota bacterium]|nr:c-type cytochrome [Myxococcota bacterium]